MVGTNSFTDDYPRWLMMRRSQSRSTTRERAQGLGRSARLGHSQAIAGRTLSKEALNGVDNSCDLAEVDRIESSSYAPDLHLQGNLVPASNQ
jgi:hypothetical protein